MGAGVVHFEIMSRDGKRAHEFYRSLFGWSVNSDNPMNYGIISPETKRAIGGGIGQVMENQTPYVTFYVGVDDPQSYLDKVVSMGGKVVIPVTEVPNMVIYAMFADPEGNFVGLVKDMPPPKPKKAKKAKKSTARKKASRSKKKSRR